MRVKVLRNIGLSTIRQFATEGVAIEPWTEGQVVDCEGPVAEAMARVGLCEIPKAPEPKAEPKPAPAPGK